MLILKSGMNGIHRLIFDIYWMKFCKKNIYYVLMSECVFVAAVTPEANFVLVS